MTGIFAIAIYLALGKVEAKGEIDYNCSEFPSKKDAQRFFENNNPEEDPYNLDGNNNGLACEHL